jgi:predicted nucleic acid-binding protein
MSGKVFLDSNVWLYTLLTSAQADPRSVLANALIGNCTRPVVSTQVIREVSVNLLKKSALTEDRHRLLIADWYASCEVIEEHQHQFIQASYLREKLSISYWDSLIVAAALCAGCEVLYTEDLQHGQVIEGQVRVVNPFLVPRLS